MNAHDVLIERSNQAPRGVVCPALDGVPSAVLGLATEHVLREALDLVSPHGFTVEQDPARPLESGGWFRVSAGGRASDWWRIGPHGLPQAAEAPSEYAGFARPLRWLLWDRVGSRWVGWMGNDGRRRDAVACVLEQLLQLR